MYVYIYIPSIISLGFRATSSFFVERGSTRASFCSDLAICRGSAVSYTKGVCVSGSSIAMRVFRQKTSKTPQHTAKNGVKHCPMFNELNYLSWVSRWLYIQSGAP